MTDATRADYTQSNDANNNPLVMTLPDFSGYVPKELAEQMLRVTQVPAKTEPKRIRAKFLRELPRELFVPTVHHFTLFQTMDSLIRLGYKDRNPNTLKSKQFLPKAGMELEMKLQDFGSDYRDGFSATLIGVSGNGKTYSVSNLLRYYPQVISHNDPKFVPGSFDQVVYLRVNCPDDGSPKSLCTEAIAELGRVTGESYSEMVGNRVSASHLRVRLAQLMNIHKVGLLVIDEIQNIVNARRNKEELFNFIVTLSNTLNVPLLFIGTPKLEKLLDSNLRTDRRLGSQGWIVWDRLRRDSEDWRLFMKHLWRCSVLSQDPKEMPVEVEDALYKYSQGIPDILVRLFVTAQTNGLMRLPKDKEKTTASLISVTFKESFSNVAKVIGAIARNDLEAMGRYEDVRMPEGRFTQMLSEKLSAIEQKDVSSEPKPIPVRDKVIQWLQEMQYKVTPRMDTEITKMCLANPKITLSEAMRRAMALLDSTEKDAQPVPVGKPKMTLPELSTFPVGSV